MDQRNKLTDTYMPDKKTTGEVVVVALSGGLKSFVAASLLKIQKYDLVAVTVETSWDEMAAHPLRPVCQLQDEVKQRIQKFCQSLSIPHHFIKATGEFQEEVVDTLIAARTMGKLSHPCSDCHVMKMKLIHSKMKELGSKKLVTGHLAKIFHQETKAYVHTSNDEENDGSAELMRLPQEILSSLVLPLSDLQMKEVIKLADNFHLTESGNANKSSCFTDSEDLHKLIESRVPASLRKAGAFQTWEEKVPLGDHEGVFNFEYGAALKLPEVKGEAFFADFSSADRKITVAPQSFFEKKKFSLIDCHISDEVHWSGPLKGVIHAGKDVWAEGWIYPKALKSALVELETPVKLLEGSELVFMKKRGRNSKIYLSGKVRFLPEETNEENENENMVKVNHHRDW